MKTTAAMYVAVSYGCFFLALSYDQYLQLMSNPTTYMGQHGTT